MPKKIKIAIIIFAIILIYALSPLAYYGIPSKYYEEISPSGKYRIEVYHPAYSIYAYCAFKKPFFIKIYNNVQRRYVYTSKLDTGYARWPTSWPEQIGEFSISYGINVTLDQLH